MEDIAYILGDSLYLNITNRCTNACSFCIRYKTHKFHGEYALWLDHEPAAQEIIKAIGDPNKYSQIVFCGYGEPLIRLDTVKEVASWIRSQSQILKPPLNLPLSKGETKEGVKIRIDTNGQTNKFYGRNILPELKDLIDIMSVSLNAEKSDVYQTICNSFFGASAYAAVIEFIKEAKKYIPYVEASVVNMPDIVDIEKCRKIAQDLGVKFRLRSYYEEKYVP